jgi:hypothetical protein
VTGDDGGFVLEEVPAGNRTLSVSAAGFVDHAMTDVAVRGNDSTCVLFLQRPAAPRATDVLTGPAVAPLLIMNGVIWFDAQFTSAASRQPGDAVQLSSLRLGILPANIASIEIVRAAAAVQLYGQRAASGVISITTIPSAPCAATRSG